MRLVKYAAFIDCRLFGHNCGTCGYRESYHHCRLFSQMVVRDDEYCVNWDANP